MRIATLIVSFVLGSLCAAVAQAQTSDYDQRITSALQAFENGRWAEARVNFKRAHELDPTARTLRTIGMCSFNLGDYVDAVQTLEAALHETKKPLTADQRAQVEGLIEKARTKLARFRLQLSPKTATLLVNGAPPRVTEGGELLLEPGRHELSVSNQGFTTQQRKVNVEAGDRATLEVELTPSTTAGPVEKLPEFTATLVTDDAAPKPEPSPAPASAPAEATPAPPSAAGESGDGSTQRTIGYVSLGVGIAAIATFTVTGVIAMGKKSDLESSCPNRSCDPSHYDDIDSYDTLRSVSTISLIAGGALLSLGAVLLLTSDDASSSEHALRLTPELGLGYAGLRGSL